MVDDMKLLEWCMSEDLLPRAGKACGRYLDGMR